MPSKKKASRAAQLHPQPTVSDYDTDNYTDNAHTLPVTAPPPVRSSEELNLLVLKRWYPHLDHIIAIAPFAVLYQCHPETQQWEKCELQGSLFICQMSPPKPGAFPLYKVIILNRKGMDNFELNLVSTENIEITEQFIMCSVMDKDAEMPRVYGLWMYSEDEEAVRTRETIGKTIMELAARAEQFGPVYDDDASYEETYESGADVALYAQAQVEVPAAQESGQRIDLATLFGKPGNIHHTTEQPPPRQGSEQQNALLDLFKNASKG